MSLPRRSALHISEKNDKAIIFKAPVFEPELLLICIACATGGFSLYWSRKEVDDMFSENLKTLRKQKGFTQEELAARLNIVRQTVSKWEKGLSVPDAELLIRLAEILEVPVSTLLGAAVPNEKEPDDIARQLSHINEQLAVKNRRSRRIWRTAAAVLIAVVVIYLLLIAVNIIAFNKFRADDPGNVQATDYVEVMPEKQK